MMCGVRILYLITDLEIGGAQKSLARLLSRIDRTRFIPVVTCLYGGDKPIAKEIQELEIQVIDQKMESKLRFDAFWRLDGQYK